MLYEVTRQNAKMFWSNSTDTIHAIVKWSSAKTENADGNSREASADGKAQLRNWAAGNASTSMPSPPTPRPKGQIGLRTPKLSPNKLCFAIALLMLAAACSLAPNPARSMKHFGAPTFILP
jgi:hypothetical protein